MKMYGTCMWKDCEEKAIYETPLDYPKIFVCEKHFDEHKKKANRQQSKILNVSHSSFSDMQRKRNLKEQYW